MAKTLLNGVNEVLKRTQIIQGDSQALATLTDSARQHFIDLAVQIWNEAIDELYTISDVALPKELVQATITLATSDRDYALASNLVQLRYPLVQQTDGYYIVEYPGGYEAMISDQPIPTNYNGRPQAAAIRPTDGELYLDFIPTSEENGDVYQYWYDKDLVLSVAADTVPFSDAVFRAMVPAVAQLFEKSRSKDFDAGEFGLSMGRASRLLTQTQQRTFWVGRSGARGFDPYA